MVRLYDFSFILEYSIQSKFRFDRRIIFMQEQILWPLLAATGLSLWANTSQVINSQVAMFPSRIVICSSPRNRFNFLLPVCFLG